MHMHAVVPVEGMNLHTTHVFRVEFLAHAVGHETNLMSLSVTMLVTSKPTRATSTSNPLITCSAVSFGVTGESRPTHQMEEMYMIRVRGGM